MKEKSKIGWAMILALLTVPVIGYFGMTKGWGVEVQSWPWYIVTNICAVSIPLLIRYLGGKSA